MTSTTEARSPVVILRGEDEVLLREEVHRLVDRLLGDADRSLSVEDHEVQGASDDERAGELARLVEAVRTPPFLTDRRIVVGRGVDKATAKELAGLVTALGDADPGTTLVLAWQTGSVPKPLLEAVKSVGGAHLDTTPARGAKAHQQWIAERLRGSGVKLQPKAVALVTETLGDDLGRLDGLLDVLESAFGDGATLDADDIAPYLGERGVVAPWELTDTIDRGDIAGALERLGRLVGSGGMHPLQLLAMLHNHYARMLALDGADVANEKEAAALLGLRGSTFPARKALEQGRRLGSARIAQAIGLLAEADLDLKGAKAWPDPLVAEVLVARLANLSRR